MNNFPIPVFRVEASDYSGLGRRIGEAAASRIVRALEARREWVDGLLSFMEEDPASRRDPFVDALRGYAPHLLDELEGISEGSGVSFQRLLAVAFNPELSALMKLSAHEDCTSIAVSGNGRWWIGHNEDGSSAYLDSTYLLDVTFPSGVRAWCFSYPGYWPGNGPATNSAGITQTVNYIGDREVQPGIPRYAIDRLVLETQSLDQALAVVTHPKRAYSQHHYLASAVEGRILSVEVSPRDFSVFEVSGIHVHANHYVHAMMADRPQVDMYRGTSRPRQRAGDKWREGRDAGSLKITELEAVLASHEGAPYSICRHPDEKVPGCTLGSALFLIDEGRLRFRAFAPCEGPAIEFSLPPS